MKEIAKAISVILNLKDNYSTGLIGVANRTKGVTKEMKSSTKQVVSWKNSFVQSVNSVTSKMVKFGIATTTALTGLAAKTGLSQAMDLEGYKMQLETATKDTKKAASIMSYAIQMANKTPFEGGELVEGASKFEAMGMSAKKWLTVTGDMAAATNKDFDQAVEALIDAQTGELERLKEFGITKAQIQEQGEKMFSDVQIVNNKGQIVNQEKFNAAMMQLLKDKFQGGMVKQATTMKGLWSTVTGVAKLSLAKIVGMNEDGSVRSGSAFDLMRNKLQLFADKLMQMQQDGSIDRIATQVTALVQKATELASAIGGRVIQVLDWMSQHTTAVKIALIGLVIVMSAFKVITFIGNIVYAINTIKTFAGMLNIAGGAIAGLASPIGIAIAVIAGLVVAGVLLYKNWDTICEYASKLKDWINRTFSNISDHIVAAFDKIPEPIKKVLDWLGEKFQWLSDKMSWLTGTFGTVGKFLGTVGTGMKAAGIGHNASGTPYWRGGLTSINERGGEIVDLPSGTRIIPHDVSVKQQGNKQNTVYVYVTVQGNVIGNREYMEQTGEYIAKKIINAMDIS